MFSFDAVALYFKAIALILAGIKEEEAIFDKIASSFCDSL